MTRVGRSDQVLLLLQEQLARLAKERGASRTGKRAGAKSDAPLDRLRQLAGAGDLSDQDRARALVRSVLLDQFGEGLGGDPRFDVLADEVVRIIGQSPGGEALVAEAFGSLRG